MAGKEHKIVSADDGKPVKTAKKTTSTAEKTVKKAEKAVEKVEENSSEKKIKDAKPTGNAKGLRIGAIILWLLAIGCEICGILVLLGKLSIPITTSQTQLIAFIVLDLAFVIIGAQLWKRANHIDPVSKKNKVKFWLWNNMGVIVCIIAFVPYIILLLRNKDLDKKTKVIAVVVAIIALLIGGVASYDFNPVSVEDKDAAVELFGDDIVYWAPFGRVYHTHTDCQSLNQTDTLTQGTVEQAIEHNRTRLCSFCARNDNITEVVIDGED